MLREYKKEDFNEIRKWCNNPEITINLSDIFIYPHSKLNTEQFLNSKLENSNLNESCFVIGDIKTEAYIGQIDLINIDWKNRTAVLGIVIGDKNNQGKGYGAEAIRLLQDFAFNSLNLNRIELAVHDYNKFAYKCYLKCGFKEEGRLRERLYINGKYIDSIYMSILKSDYLKNKKK